jgi:signal peptidase I
MWGRIGGVIGAAIGLVAVAFVVFFFVVSRGYVVPSSSMEPTLHCARPAPGCEATRRDRVLAFTHFGWGRNDLVVFHTPDAAVERCGAGGTFIKRVVGLPGERVSERNGRFFIDGEPYADPVAPGRRDTETRSWPRLGGDRYFLVGDNRRQSCDSRVFGPVAKSAVIGRVYLVYWPPSRLGFR